MKILRSLVLLSLLCSGNAFAGDIYSLVWQISGVKDDSDVPVLGMVLDGEYGKSVYRVNGIMFLEGGAAGAVGTAYEGDDAGTLYVYLNVAHHFFLVTLGSGLNGTISLYGADGEVIDEGTVTYMGQDK